MINSVVLPAEAQAEVGTEFVEFAVKGKTHRVVKGIAGFGVLSSVPFLVVIIGFGLFFFWPVISGQASEIIINGVPTMVGRGNMMPLLLPGVLFGVFLLITLVPVIVSLYFFFRRGGIYIGTPSRLIHYAKHHTRSIAWGDFSSTIQVSGNDKKGTISLQLDRGGSALDARGVPVVYMDGMYMSGIPNPREIADICRKRIAEHKTN